MHLIFISLQNLEIPVSDCVHVSNSASFDSSFVSWGLTSDVFEVSAGLFKSNFGAKGFCFLAGFQKPQ